MLTGNRSVSSSAQKRPIDSRLTEPRTHFCVLKATRSVYERVKKCLDVQHRYADIAQRQRQQPALRAATAAALAPTPHHLVAVGVAIATVVGLPGRAALQGHAGPKLVRPCHTHWIKCNPFNQFARPLRREQRRNLTCVTYSCAMRGTIGKVRPKSCTSF